MKLATTAAAMIGCLMLTSTAQAHHSQHERKAEHHYREAERHYRIATRHERRAAQDSYRAPVVEVEPVYRYRAYQDSCVEHRPVERGHQSWAPTILGAVIGGAVGHRIGDSHGDPEVAAIAGTALGAAIGRDIGQRNARNRAIAVRGPCVPRDDREWRGEPVEYVVHYRYNGRVYRTRMDYHPGEWVRLDDEGFPV
jgi:uncharacterized protein YcfJ